MGFDARVARNLAAALLCVEWTKENLQAALSARLGGRRKRALARLSQELFEQGDALRLRPPARLEALLLASNYFERAKKDEITLSPVLEAPAFSSVEAFRALDVPRLSCLGNLAAWLGLTAVELDWFSDARRLQRRTTVSALRHYDHAFVAKASAPPRLLEAPKSRLKALQRQILREILDVVPVHPAAHGFIAGRSCAGGASVHAGERLVVTVDLKDFFLTAPMGRVYALFRALGYPHAVAGALTRLCGTRTPSDVFDDLPPPLRYDLATRRHFAELHLPQGAPTSPALANAVAFRLDLRLAGLARRHDVAYTRYADDLAFSGDDAFARRRKTFLSAVEKIVEDEGFCLNARKTRIMPASVRQRVTGIVVNSYVNVTREGFDALKATLHNCARNGPSAENSGGHADFRAHLDGRVNWVETLNRARGEKLRRMFEQIDWRR